MAAGGGGGGAFTTTLLKRQFQGVLFHLGQCFVRVASLFKGHLPQRCNRFFCANHPRLFCPNHSVPCSSELTKSPPEGVSVGLKDDNLFHWTIMIVGPPGTSVEGGFFKAELKFPETFPNLPPEMRFISQMWHPNSCVMAPPHGIKQGSPLSHPCFSFPSLPTHTMHTHATLSTSFSRLPPFGPSPFFLPAPGCSLAGWKGVHINPSPPWH